MSATEQTPPARSLAEELRRWSDARLGALLRDRPDLTTPAPHDSTQLASRAATRSSLHRALDGLDRFELTTLDALCVLGQTTHQEVRTAVHAAPDAVDATLTRLLDLALVWPASDGLRVLSGVADALRGGLTEGVSGLWPRTSAPPSDAEVAQRLTSLSAQARALLDHVATHGGQATTGSARRTVSVDDARTPAEELIARRLLVGREDGTLVLPGEVGLHLRGGHTTVDAVDRPPTLATASRDPVLVERNAAGAAFEFVRRTELLLDQWGARPPAILRNGGLAVRDLRGLARDMHVDEAGAALLVEVAATAGLLAEGVDVNGDAVWVPTEEFDAWVARPTEERWSALVVAWLDSPRVASLAGTPDPAGRTWNALAPELSSAWAPEARRQALDSLAALPAGEVLATGTGGPSVVARARWMRPRRPAVFGDLVSSALDEAAALGIVGAGGLSTAGRALLGGDASATAEAVAAHLPRPVDHLLLQADLTAVAPGPLELALARSLHLLADVESRGGATVYRFTPGSVRRAYDAGWSAAEVHAFLDDVSSTAVPQPLSYLVDDVSRTFGTVRVGHAEAFLRSDDETALKTLVTDPAAASLGLRLLAPTVAISTAPLDVLLPRLRELGTAPVVEAPDGTVRVARPDLLRARRPRRRTAPIEHARREAGIAAVVTAVRAGDRVLADAPRRREATTPAAALAALREAIEARGTVVIGYLDAQGVTSERLVDPLRLDGGRLSAYDHRADDRREFAVHRISSVRAPA